MAPGVLTCGDAPDYGAASDAARGFAPAHRLVATKLIVDHALRSGRNKVALSVAMAEVKAGEADEGLARLVLRAINATSLPGSAEELLSSDVFTDAVSFVLEVVSRTPANGKLRIELARTLATESMGLYGLATLLSITLGLARKPQKAESVPQFASWAKPASENEIMGYLRPALGWMAASFLRTMPLNERCGAWRSEGEIGPSPVQMLAEIVPPLSIP
jgi:hypothetical protein